MENIVLKVIENGVKEIVKPCISKIESNHKLQIICDQEGGVIAKLIQKRHPIVKKKMRLKYNDGTVYPQEGETSAVNVLLQAIRNAGSNRVFDLGIFATGGRNLLSRDFESIENMQPFKVDNEFFVITKTPTTAKIEQIRTIIDKLNPDFDLEVIEK